MSATSSLRRVRSLYSNISRKVIVDQTRPLNDLIDSKGRLSLCGVAVAKL